MYQEKEVHYDLLHVMMICLGDSKKVDNEILKLLDVLLKDETSVEVKKRKLEEDVLIEQLMGKFQLTKEKVLEYMEMSDCSEPL